MLRHCTIVALLVWLAAPVAPAGAQRCEADCDGSGGLDFFDFLCFQDRFAGRDPRADCDRSGDLDFFDFLCFQDLFAAGCPAGVATDLACVQLGGYPHVDYVQAFDAGDVVMIGSDPTTHPISGACDVYVVAARDAAGWASDPALLDVRPSGAQRVAFVGGLSIRDNTFALDGSSALESDAGERVGRAYDLVVDVNRNGVLDRDDLIDGAGDSTGFFVFRDLTTLGPAPTTRVDSYAVTFPGIAAGRDRQRLTYPSDIAGRGDVPVVIISPASGAALSWYDYLHDLFASHGWVVMTHQENAAPGIEAASDALLRHTDAFYGSLATIAGGALAGRLDVTRTIWIGQGRGGEAVARALDKLFDGAYSPMHYGLDDLILASSVAPTDFLQSSAHPHASYYHVMAGSADGEVTGSPQSPVTQYWASFERAEGRRAATYIHGADHNDFNCCGFNDFTGPTGTEIGRHEAQQAAKVVWHALLENAAFGNAAVLEYVQRQQENSRPAGVQATTIVNHEYRSLARAVVLDDFQTNPSAQQSSSGEPVSFTVTNLVEGRLDDGDTSFTSLPADPMNGMTRTSSPGDASRGIVFDYQADSFLEFAVAPAGRDFTQFGALSWRACQQTRHPDTMSHLGEQVYEVSVRDSAGRASTIRIDAYSAGHEEPYQRTGAGIGAGWGNEFETIRIRPGDFARDGGHGIDLTDIRALRFSFGPSHGTARGRLGLDDLQFNRP